MIKTEIKEVLSRGDKKEYRKFGFTIGIFLIIVSIILFIYSKPSALNFLYTGADFVLLGMVVPLILKPVYFIWMTFAVILGFFMTRVILTILYVILFVPVGIVVRLLRKDLLDEKYDSSAESYWIRREKVTYDPKSAENQY